MRQALREALVNALTHADYYDRRGLVIQRLPNQIRIANPGAFRVDVREALAGGVSDPRNAVLIRLFRLIGAGGGQGGLSGIRAVWQSQGWQAPQIVESFGPDRTILTLPLRPMPSTAGLRQDLIVFLTDAAAASAGEIAGDWLWTPRLCCPFWRLWNTRGFFPERARAPADATV